MGQDYRIGDDLDFDDDNNLGQGAAGFVRVVNGGVKVMKMIQATILF